MHATPFAAWLHENDLGFAEFGRLVGADRRRIHRYARGEREPGRAISIAIERATNGAIRADSWPERIRKPRRPRRSRARRAA